MFFGVIFIICAFVCGVYNKWEDYQAQQASDELLRKAEMFAAETDETGVCFIEAELAGQRPDSEEISSVAQDTEFAKMDILGQSEEFQEDVFAILEIPYLDLRLPVLNKYSQDGLRRYVCRYGAERCEDGQFVIVGHNYKSHFKALSDLAVGEHVFLIFPEGEQEYAVSELMEIDGGDSEGLFSGEWDLSLFTCDFSGERRVVVRCVKVQD